MRTLVQFWVSAAINLSIISACIVGDAREVICNNLLSRLLNLRDFAENISNHFEPFRFILDHFEAWEATFSFEDWAGKQATQTRLASREFWSTCVDQVGTSNLEDSIDSATASSCRL